jgi:Cu+-exporting ATPase
VTYDKAHVATTDLLTVIRTAGYTPGNARVRLGIAGMTCASCVIAVEQALHKTPGVVAASINAAMAQADVESRPGLVDFQGIQHAIAASGYQVVETPPASETGVSQEDTASQHEYRTLMRKFWFAAVISISVMAFSYPDLILGLRDWMPMGSVERRIVWSVLRVLTLHCIIF